MISQQEVDTWTESADKDATDASEAERRSEASSNVNYQKSLWMGRAEDHRIDAAHALKVASTISVALELLGEEQF